MEAAVAKMLPENLATPRHGEPLDNGDFARALAHLTTSPVDAGLANIMPQLPVNEESAPFAKALAPLEAGPTEVALAGVMPGSITAQAEAEAQNDASASGALEPLVASPLEVGLAKVTPGGIAAQAQMAVQADELAREGNGTQLPRSPAEALTSLTDSSAAQHAAALAREAADQAGSLVQQAAYQVLSMGLLQAESHFAWRNICDALTFANDNLCHYR